MSRRECRYSDSRRHRSRFDEEPSPKRSRRDGKPATERPSSNLNSDGAEHSDRDQKHHHRLQDALPLEAPPLLHPKAETRPVSKEPDKESTGNDEGLKHIYDPMEVPRSRSYFQHDDRGKDGQVGRSFSRRAAAERGSWRESKNRQSDRATNRMTTEMQQTEEKSKVQGNNNCAWHHDRYFEMEADPKPPVRKRPAFQEKKVTSEPENAEKTAAQDMKPNHPNRPLTGTERREDRRDQKPSHFDRAEMPLAGNRDTNRGEAQRGNFFSRERSGAGGNYRGRERFASWQGNRPSGVRVEKWKHDLFDEANRSPSPEKEEDQIARLEALLAS